MKLKSPEILRAFMDQKGFSMSRLARYAGCSRQMIWYLVKGEKSTCTIDLADDIAEALDVPTVALFDRMESAVRGRNSGNRRTAGVA